MTIQSRPCKKCGEPIYVCKAKDGPKALDATPGLVWETNSKGQCRPVEGFFALHAPLCKAMNPPAAAPAAAPAVAPAVDWEVMFARLEDSLLAIAKAITEKPLRLGSPEEGGTNGSDREHRIEEVDPYAVGTLHQHEGKTVEELARTFNITEAEVKKHLATYKKDLDEAF